MQNLEPREIRSQLGRIPQFAEELANSIIINCWRVGNRPGMDLIYGEEMPRFNARGFDELA